MSSKDDFPEIPEKPLRISYSKEITIPVRLLWAIVCIVVAGVYGFTTFANILSNRVKPITELYNSAWTVIDQEIYIQLMKKDNPTLVFPDVESLHKQLRKGKHETE